MEHIVNFPAFWDVQLIRQGSQNFLDPERSLSFGCKLLWIGRLQVSSVQPDLVSFLKRFSVSLESFKHANSSQLMGC